MARVGEGEARATTRWSCATSGATTRRRGRCSATSPAPTRSATASCVRTGGRARCATSSSSRRWRRRGWAATLRDVLKAAGGDVLVTLGQDEGGTGTRPAQLLHADAVDYTAVHTWWNNDDLLWDGVMTKAAGKPNMHQETGLMSLHDPDGAPWRTPAAAADLLDRKFAYAFAGRGAGVIQWAWNVNPYMPIDNESTIGVNRPDGTAKLEMDAFSRLRLVLRGGGALPRRLRPRAGGPRRPVRAALLGTAGGDRPHEAARAPPRRAPRRRPPGAARHPAHGRAAARREARDRAEPRRCWTRTRRERSSRRRGRGRRS